MCITVQENFTKIIIFSLVFFSFQLFLALFGALCYNVWNVKMSSVWGHFQLKRQFGLVQFYYGRREVQALMSVYRRGI